MSHVADTELLPLLRRIADDLSELTDVCEDVEGHRLSEWSALFEQHGGAIWLPDEDATDVPPWAVNAPYLAGALKIVSKSLQDAHDASLRADAVYERIARDRVFCFGQLASASVWCMRRLVLDGGEKVGADS